MIRFVTSVLILLCVGSANAQDICKMLGQKNPHGMAMEVKAPMYVVDSVNFSVESMKPLPYNIGAQDTVFFNVCLHKTDGKTYSTQVRYNTTHGIVSYVVTMVAVPASVPVAGSTQLRLSGPFPNPANESVSVDFDGLPEGTLEVFNSLGESVGIYPANHASSVTIATTEFPNGAYSIRLTGLTQQSNIVRFTVSR